MDQTTMRWALRQPSMKMPRQIEDFFGGLPNLSGHFQHRRVGNPVLDEVARADQQWYNGADP
jgi:hypothetical protein